MSVDVETAIGTSLSERRTAAKTGFSPLTLRQRLGGTVGQLMADRIASLFRGYIAHQHICEGPDANYQWTCVVSSGSIATGAVLARCPECDQMMARGSRRISR